MKLSPVEYDLNMLNLQSILKNVPPHLRDLIQFRILKLDQHVQALENELRRVNDGETISEDSSLSEESRSSPISNR